MRAVLELVQRLKGLLRRSRSDADLEEELRVHLELAAERDAARTGVPAAAMRAARVRAGGQAQAMEQLRDQRSLPSLEALAADVVFGWRQLVRHRTASVSAILSLGLALGATMAAFRLVDTVLVRPLPVADASRRQPMAVVGNSGGPVTGVRRATLGVRVARLLSGHGHASGRGARV